MENYTGRVCPFCKTEIKEGDAVKVCPTCQIPHHEKCWEEHKGCTTYGCPEQPHKEQNASQTHFCSQCGAALENAQMFCPKCGTPKEKKNVCGNCGTELQDGQAFCPKCGQNAGGGTGNKQSRAKKKKGKIIGAAILVAALISLVVTGALIAPKMFISIEELCAQGNYEKAYKKAEEKQKKEIIAENFAAVQSAVSASSLKNPSSFQLREAYYNEIYDDGLNQSKLVLQISGTNSYGATVTSYWLYAWDNDEHNWYFYCSVSDLAKEEASEYDDEDEKWEKFVKNSGRDHIKHAMQNGLKLSKDAVRRINDQFAAGTLDEVTLLNVD